MISVGIVGGTGYTGVELLRLLLRHPQARVDVLTSRTEAGKRVADMFPSLRGHTELEFSDLDLDRLKQCDVVFFATPHGVAMQHAQELIDADTKVIDLAADFRLQNLAEFEKWYGMQHSCPTVLTESVYGLTELNREKIKNARVIGNPGCYPTTVQLGLAPLLKNDTTFINTQNIIIDAKSGVSGAGRKASLGMIYSENADNFKAYGVAGHRHHPEIVEALENISGQKGQFNQILFVPNDYQEKNTNITSNTRKKKRMFILPIILGLTVTISSYKIYAVVSNIQEAKNNTYKGEENIQVSSIELNDNMIVASFNNNHEEKNNIKNEDKEVFKG